MSDTHAPGRRALLVLGHTLPQDEALSRAVALTARVSAELHALFIEDEDVLRAAALPISPRLFRGLTVAQPLHAEGIIEAWRALSERARQTLQREAQHHHVSIEFEVLRESRMRPLVQLGAAFDLTMFAGARPAHTSDPWRTAVVPSSDFVKVLYDGSAAGERALALAISLANAAHPLQVWCFRLAAAARTELVTRLRSQVGSRVSFRELPDFEPSREAVLRMLLSAGGGTLLLPQQAALAGMVGALSRDVMLPLVVVLTR